MDSENKILMTVDTGNSAKTIADLKKQIQELKKALDQEVVGSESAKKATEELANAQNELKQAIKGSTDVIEIAKGSYYDLNRQCEQLKVTYKSMADGIEKNKIAKRIAELQEELKKQDAAIGDFKRNVGDYANSFTTALSSMGLGANGLTKGLYLATNATKGFKVGLDALSKHPILLLIGAFVVALKNLYDAFKKNEEAVLKIKEAFAPIEGFMNAVYNSVTKLTDAIGEGLAKAISTATDLLSKMFSISTNKDFVIRMEEAKEIEKENQKLEKDRIDMIKTEADYEKELNRLRSLYKRYAKDDATAGGIALQIEKERRELLLNKVSLAQRAYDLKVKENAQTKSNNKDIEEENRLYAELVSLQGQLETHSEEYIKFMRSADPQWQKAALEEQVKDLLNQQAEIDKAADIVIERMLAAEERGQNVQKKYYEDQLDTLTEKSVTVAKELDKIIGKEGELEKVNRLIAEEAAKNGQKILDDLLRKQENLEKTLVAWSQTELENLKTQYDEDLKILDQSLKKKLISQEKYNKDKLLLDQKYAADEARIIATATRQFYEDAKSMANAGDTSSMVNYENVNFNELKANHKLTQDEEYEHQKRLLEIQRWGLEERQKFLQERLLNTENFHNLSLVDQQKYLQEYEKLTEQISLVNSQLSASDAENARRRAEAAKAEKQMKLNAYLDMADSIGSIFTSIADTMDENNEKQFEAAKAFNIAGATINTITGAIDAYMGAVGNTGLNAIPVVGPAIAMAMGITNAAAVTAAGVANIAKIARQKYNGGTSGANATASFSASSGGISAVNAPVQYTSAVEGAAINDNIQNTKVYVTETDLQNTAQKVSVQESENRF